MHSILGTVERKVLGALLILADDNNVVTTTLRKIANQMDYKASGGAISFALKILERDNFIIRNNTKQIKILI
ncbi:MAG: hypothetical protein PHX62_04710 [Bacilli bacterium]|nr:hypothetical protein [Bacilli bacterium]